MLATLPYPARISTPAPLAAVMVERQQRKLGVVVQPCLLPNGDEAVLVKGVVPGSAATQLYTCDDARQFALVPGRDCIAAVNGRPVTTASDLHRLLRCAARRCRLEIFDRETGETEIYLTRLAPLPHAAAR